MMNRYYIRGFMLALTGMILSLYGCNDELEGMGDGIRPSDVICFKVSLVDTCASSATRSAGGNLSEEQNEWQLLGESDEKEGATRGVPVSLLSGSAGVIGYVYDTWSETVTPWTSLNNAEYTFDGDELSAKTNDVRWNTLNQSNVSLYVYAPYTPYNVTGRTLDTDGGKPTITYEVSESIPDQQDIIVASWEGTNDYKKTIPLMFEHALTGVRFKVGFKCTVTQLEIQGIYNKGTYTFGDGWTVDDTSEKVDYTFSFVESETGKAFNANEALTSGENTMMMIPQTLADDAKVVLTYKENGEEQTVTASLKGKVWQEGKMITYTIHKDAAPTTIYFDLAAGNVSIGSTYSGKIYVNGVPKDVTGSHADDNVYYVYQSSTSDESYNATKTGYATENDFKNRSNCRIPDYAPVTYNGKLWSDYITNHTDVDEIIGVWFEDSTSETASKVGRTGTENNITVSAVENKKFKLVIDDIYSTFQNHGQGRQNGGITFSPATTPNCVLTISTLGDNRLGNIFYYNKPNNFKSSANINSYNVNDYDNYNINNGSQIIFEGTGSLTVADVMNKKGQATGFPQGEPDGYFGNYYCAAIGGNDDGTHEEASGIVINSGVLFAGSTAAENCSAIGGGGNGFGEVIINGGTVTAVASTTGTAIGGGIGYSSHGGEGRVTINGGNVYAYNLDNKRGIPSSAIGGAGSNNSVGTWGTVNITGGYVYAYSALGTAIGGGSSGTKTGGNAVVNITGGQVIAKSERGAGIGGGSACTRGGSGALNGGTAYMNISGSPILRTGSIGGGSTKASEGKIGSAVINVSGGDIQAQFVMAAGAKEIPSFTMSGGIIRNSDVNDEEYIHLQEKGGAVYLEDGTFLMSGGTIKNCSAIQGGAVYIDATKQNEVYNFKMTGGEIVACDATGSESVRGHGGALCLNGGQVLVTGGRIWNNYTENGNGGAVYVSNGNFFMNGTPEISENSAQKGNGGGVYVTSEDDDTEVTVELLGGNIVNNAASNYGGGVCVDMGQTSNKADVTVGVDGQGVEESDANPKISGNTSMMSGGGLYVRGSSAHVTINSGMIDKNSVASYVKNENVANEGGMVTLNNGKVTHVVVTFNGNQGQVQNGGETSYTQKLVTNTNSRITANRFVRAGYTFDGWNTRMDGLGTDYSDEHVMNISENIMLYAKWKSQ